MIKNLDIALIGCGKMGSAMLRGLLSAGIASHISILDPGGLPAEFAQYEPDTITHYLGAETFSASPQRAQIYIMAVKPQIMDEVCRMIAHSVPQNALILSIAAGQTIAAFTRRFGENRAIVRAMPNTPAAIGKGITVAAANPHVSQEQKEQANAILQSIGLVEWVEREELLDPVTAVSGSGPAYVFYMVEALARAGENAGLEPDFAMKLASRTVIGAAALAEADGDTPAARLRENVTSPGGTTAAALEVLMDGEFQAVMNRAIAAATARSKELSS